MKNTPTMDSDGVWTLNKDEVERVKRQYGSLPPQNLLVPGEKRCLRRHHAYACQNCGKLWALAGTQLVLMCVAVGMLVWKIFFDGSRRPEERWLPVVPSNVRHDAPYTIAVRMSPIRTAPSDNR